MHPYFREQLAFGDAQRVIAMEKNIRKVIGILQRISESFQMLQLAELLA
jgi:hypothetical protein